MCGHVPKGIPETSECDQLVPRVREDWSPGTARTALRSGSAGQREASAALALPV